VQLIVSVHCNTADPIRLWEGVTVGRSVRAVVDPLVPLSVLLRVVLRRFLTYFQMQASSMVPSEQRIFAALNAALQPTGILPDLSRIMAAYARPGLQWDASAAALPKATSGPALTPLSLDSERKSARLLVASEALTDWAVTELAIGDFPVPSRDPPNSGSAEAKSAVDSQSGVGTARSPLRVWTIHLDEADDAICMGVLKPVVTSLEPHGGWGSETVTLSSHSSSLFGSGGDIGIGLPWTASNAVGCFYHFTADLARGTLTVRPKLLRDNRIAEDPAAKQEWILAEGLRDLAAYRVYVAMRRKGSACTLMETGEAPSQ
jgi:hypothetical protein